METQDMQVIGLCRFSYPAMGGFQVEHETIEERIAYLYDPTRLEERFRLFETVALPCLRHQTDPNFDVILVVGDSLPKKHMNRLRDLTADIPQVAIVAMPPQPQRDVMKELLRVGRNDRTQPCLQFRHDDDDAIALDFVERLRRDAAGCTGLLEANRTVAFDYNRGYIAEMGPDGIAATSKYRRLYVASLGMYVRGGAPVTIMNFAHEKIDRFMPVVSFTDCPMWVRTHNGYNDSRQKPVKPVPVTALTPEEEAEFADRFAISADHVRQVFSAPLDQSG